MKNLFADLCRGNVQTAFFTFPEDKRTVRILGVDIAISVMLLVPIAQFLIDSVVSIGFDQYSKALDVLFLEKLLITLRHEDFAASFPFDPDFSLEVVLFRGHCPRRFYRAMLQVPLFLPLENPATVGIRLGIALVQEVTMVDGGHA